MYRGWVSARHRAGQNAREGDAGLRPCADGADERPGQPASAVESRASEGDTDERQGKPASALNY